MFDFYKSHISIASLNNMKEHTFTVNGFSKGFSTWYKIGIKSWSSKTY